MITISRKYYYLYFGLLAGLVFILYNQLNVTILKNAGGISSIIGMMAHFLILLYSVRYFVKHFSDGYFTFGMAYKKCQLISLIGALLNGTYVYIAYSLKPGLLADMKVLAEESYLNSGMSEDQVDLLSQMFELYLTPFAVALSSFLLITIGSLLLGLIVSSMVKREQNPLEKPGE